MITNCPSKIQRYRNEYGFKANSKYFVKCSNLEQNKLEVLSQRSDIIPFLFLLFFNYSQSLYQPRDVFLWYFKRIRVVIKKGKADVTEKAYFSARNPRMSWLNLFCGSPRYDKFSPFPVSRCNNHLLSSWPVPVPMDEVATRFYSRSPGDQWDSSTSGLSLMPRGKMWARTSALETRFLLSLLLSS